MKHRLISLILALTLLLACLPQLALLAGAAETSGKCGENLTWSFDGDTGTLTIAGSGDMDDYSQAVNSGQPAPWHAFRENIRALQLPDGLTGIGEYAFAGCENLPRVTIPDGVTRIGSCAFSWCHSLTEIAVPDSVTEIGADAFSYCFDLERVTLPEGVRCGGWVGDCFDILFSPKKDGTYQFYFEGYDNRDDGFACNMILTDQGGNMLFDSSHPSVCSVDACTADVWLKGGEKYRVSLVHGGSALILDTYWNFRVRFLTSDKVFRFEDVPETAFYADSVGWALVKDVTKGMDETHFGPDRGCTRGQVVTFLARAFAARAYSAFPLSNYEIVESRATWDEALAYAKSKDGSLVSFDSPEEYRFVLELIDREELWDNTYFCIGARREPDGSDYFWTDADNNLTGQPLNRPDAWCADCWEPGEPNLVWNDRQETVVMMYYDKAEARWVWYDASPTVRSAGRNYAYIIEYD